MKIPNRKSLGNEFFSVLGAVALAASATSCSSTVGQGAAIGAGTGAVIGGVAKDNVKGAATGAAIGAVLGSIGGAVVENQRSRQSQPVYDSMGGDVAHPGHEVAYPYATTTNEYGIVRSPYHPYTLIDVRNINSGSVVLDPVTEKPFLVP